MRVGTATRGTIEVGLGGLGTGAEVAGGLTFGGEALGMTLTGAVRFGGVEVIAGIARLRARLVAHKMLTAPLLMTIDFILSTPALFLFKRLLLVNR